MMRYILTSILTFFLMTLVTAQQFNAGPDTSICSGTGIFLGDTEQNIPSTWCITWSPAESLDDPHSAFPRATPKNTTTYTATVLTENWENVLTDQVVITVGFGGIKFSPPYLYQGGEDTVQAEVLINPDMDSVVWSIEGASLGCVINPATGELWSGNEFGKITVRAAKANDPDCYAEEEIEINEGVKDLIARDATHPERIAQGDRDTLYLIGETNYLVTAVPNADGFSNGAPFWYDDLTPHAEVPVDGQITVSGSVPLEEIEHHYTAGSEAAGFKPNVVIYHLVADEFQIDLSPLVNEITDKIDKINKQLVAKIKKKYASLPELNVEVNVAALKYKRNNVELYNNPGWGKKYTFEAGGSLALSGKVYHPQFTQLFDLSLIGIVAGTELYIEPFFEASLTGAMVKDPSKEDATWNVLGNPIKASVTGGIRGAFNVVGTSTGYSLEGGFSLNSEVTMDFTFYPSNGEYKVKITLSPLQGITKVLIERYVDPKKKWTFFNYTVDLVDKWQSPDYLLFNFDLIN